MSKSLLVALAIATILACDANLGSIVAADSGTEAASDTESGDDDSSPIEPVPCIGGELCPEGSSCANSVCATDCSSDDECLTAQWCADQLCQPDEVPTCKDDDDCVAAQVCLSKLCITIGESECNLDDFLLDGCPSNALCHEATEPEVGYCHELPACADDLSCPIGIIGSVCNTGQIPNKDQICLIGACETAANCPAEWQCVTFDGEPIGNCSDGTFGSACVLNTDCLSGVCVPIPAAGGGFCQ